MVRNQKAIFMMVVVLVVPSTENASLLPVQNVLIKLYNQNELRGGYISAAYFKNKHDDNAALY